MYRWPPDPLADCFDGSRGQDEITAGRPGFQQNSVAGNQNKEGDVALYTRRLRLRRVSWRRTVEQQEPLEAGRLVNAVTGRPHLKSGRQRAKRIGRATIDNGFGARGIVRLAARRRRGRKVFFVQRNGRLNLQFLFGLPDELHLQTAFDFGPRFRVTLLLLVFHPDQVIAVLVS